MRSPAEIKTLIEARLKKYISRDRTGIRRAMLQLFLKIRTLTIAQIFEELNKTFVISYHSVAAMVGIIASRIGILQLPGPRWIHPYTASRNICRHCIPYRVSAQTAPCMRGESKLFLNCLRMKRHNVCSPQ